MSDEGDLDTNRPDNLLNKLSDRAEDMGVSYSLEFSERVLIGEYDPAQIRSVDLTTPDDMGPTCRHFLERRSIAPQHLVTDGISVDGLESILSQDPAHSALSAPDAPADHPTMPFVTHRPRQ